MSDIDRIANNIAELASAVHEAGILIWISALYIGTMIYFRKK